jgi:uncharacterized protein
MESSIFNLQVPVPDRNEVFLMNTFSDAQLLVSPDVAGLLERLDRRTDSFSAEEREAIDALVENGFIVESRASERATLDQYFRDLRESSEDLRVTVLTTLQCNFACDYCFQGDHGDYNKFAHKMSMETAAQVIAWIEERLDTLHPEKFVLTLFGGEPLLNLPVAYYLAEATHRICAERGIAQFVNVITNGLLLTPEVVDRLAPYGLNGVKVTLDGDRDTHNRMRPLRGRQGTFDRIIENVRHVANKVPITIGGNFDESSADSYPALLDFLKEQEFADKIAKVNFKPIIKDVQPQQPKGLIPLTLVSGAAAAPEKPGGTCMTVAGAGGLGKKASACDTCHFVDEKLAFLRDETRKRGFPTPDGIHMGPCEIHRKHAYTLGPDGALYTCPGFTGEPTESVGHISGKVEPWHAAAIARYEQLTPHKEECGDCSYVPVCGGGCSVAARAEASDMHAPSCHKSAFESALVSLALRTSAAQAFQPSVG